MSKKEKFEDKLKKLENIVENLEKGDISLDESLSFFETGVKLIKDCQAKLEDVERKIQVLTKREDGIVKSSDFEENDNF